MPSERDRRNADAVRAAARLAKVAGTALAEGDMTLAQYRVLVFLDAGARPATQVAQLLDVTPPTVTSLVDALESRGLVARSADPDDRRRVVCSLTPAGRRALQRGDVLVGERLGRLLDRLAPGEAEQAVSGLEALNRAMELALADRFGRPGDPR
ncbi:MAG: MarR family winged helix-turn-helix transcriptional regulator [Microthrixaceae bacterium]